jgi:hypothetical protein
LIEQECNIDCFEREEKIMSRRIISGILLTLIVVSIFTASNIGPISAVDVKTNSEFLRLDTTENVTILEDGTAQLAILMNASSAPLAEMYRKLLGAPQNAGVEEEMPIPENATQTIDSGGNVSEVQVSARGEFYKSIVKEQRLSLGLFPKISESRMVPNGSVNECRVSIDAQSFFEACNITKIDTDVVWEIGVGPLNATGITGFVLTRLLFTKLMLESLEGEQIYEDSWRVRIVLPANATLLNRAELTGLNWTVDFGGGSCMNASLLPDQSSTLILNERVVVTEQNITATPEYLYEILSNYKAFRIRYSIPDFASEPQTNGDSSVVNPNFSHDFKIEARFTIPFSYEYEDSKGNSFNLRLNVAPEISITEHIGWQFRVLWYPPFIQTDWFEASINLTTSIRVRLEATAEVTLYENTWKIFEWNWPFSFYVGVPVYVDLRLQINATLTIEGKMSFAVETVVNGGFKAGLRWDKTHGWSPIWNKNLDSSPPDTDWEWAIGVSVIPGILFRFSVLFYKIVGPSVEFELYATIEATAIGEDIDVKIDCNITLNYRVSAGIVFGGWLKRLLNLEDYLWVLSDVELMRWNRTLYASPTLPTAVHDLSVISIETSPTMILTDTVADVNILVRNNGDFNETFKMDLFLDNLPLNHANVNLNASEDTSLHFNWNTAGLIPNNHTLEVQISPVEGEINIDDNVKNVTVYIVDPIDIALLDVLVDANEVYVGKIINITVTVKNLNNTAESFNVTAHYNNITISTQYGQLVPGEEVTLEFQWDTAKLTNLGFSQTCIVWAEVNPSHYDINATNNIFIAEKNSVEIGILGDINGDKKVDGKDIAVVAQAFGSYLGHPRWNQDADLNRDNKIEGKDMTFVAKSFGKTYP